LSVLVCTSMPSATRVEQAPAARAAGDLDHAQPAGADHRHAVHPAQARDRDLVLAADLDDGLVLARGQVLAVDLQRDDADHAAPEQEGRDRYRTSGQPQLERLDGLMLASARRTGVGSELRPLLQALASAYAGCGSVVGAVAAAIGTPQCGQVGARSETWPPHSGQSIKAML
jgi:hypothetical protein